MDKRWKTKRGLARVRNWTLAFVEGEEEKEENWTLNTVIGNSKLLWLILKFTFGWTRKGNGKTSKKINWLYEIGSNWYSEIIKLWFSFITSHRSAKLFSTKYLWWGQSMTFWCVFNLRYRVIQLWYWVVLEFDYIHIGMKSVWWCLADVRCRGRSRQS